jgi:hypothetical protein
MIAAKYNITLDRAADYSFVLTVNNLNGDPVDLTGDQFVGDIRLIRSKREALQFSINNSGASGQATLTLSAAATKTLRAGTGIYEYDVFLIRSSTNGGRTIRLIEGSVTVRPQFTNDV